jgi:hypothetical protein
MFVRKLGSLPVWWSLSQAKSCCCCRICTCMQRDTAAFREPYVHFLWSPTNWLRWTSNKRHMDFLYILIGDMLAGPMPFQDTPSLQKLVVPCFDPCCIWGCFLINTILPLHIHNGLELRKPHNKSHLLLSWRCLCVKCQQRP